MPKRNQVQLDQLIHEALEEKIKEHPPPDLTPSQAWERMEKSVKSTKPPKRLYSLPIVVAAAVLALIMFTWSPQNGVAFNPFTSLYHTVQGSVVQLFGKIGGEDDILEAKDTTENSSEGTYGVVEGTESTSEQMSLEEAEKVMMVPIKLPKVLPEEFKLEQVTVLKHKDRKSNEVVLNYVGDGRGFMLMEYAVMGNQFGFGEVMDADDVKIEEFLLNGHKASLVVYKNGIHKLIWFTQTHYFMIEGNLTKSEIVDIAKSI